MYDTDKLSKYILIFLRYNLNILQSFHVINQNHSGEYICRAENGCSSPQKATWNIEVLDQGKLKEWDKFDGPVQIRFQIRNTRYICNQFLYRF